MKPPQGRLAHLWCRLMHTEPMWPSHGQYECRTCGRRHPVRWEQPAPGAPRLLVVPRDAQAQNGLARTPESRIQCQ